MAIESQNIYKNARKSAGFTQEKASQLLNVSVDSLRDYEQSQRPVPSDVASAMCDVYQAPYLAVQHLRLTSDLGKRVVPEIQLKDLPEAVLGVLAAVQRFCAKREAMVEIAADGQIAESEQAEWDEIMCLANDLNVAIRKIYEYDGAEYIIRVPEGAKDILQESKFLDHCIQHGTRYFERISVRESYIFFLRKKSDPNTPWYTLEVEPGGTVRQKRSYNNDQYADLEDAKPFIEEWQQVVQGRMTASEISFAKQSKEIRAQEFAELKENGNIIRTGANAGKLLVDELMHDLMEVEKRVG